MIKITGETPKFQRVVTGWYSFDRALADQTEVGYPLGQILEIYGPSGVGKSTVVHSLAGILARENKSNISIADFEGINQKLMLANLELQKFDGEVHWINPLEAKKELKKDEKNTDERMLQILTKDIASKNYSVGILDAVGSISPVSEATGDLGDANMGRRAMLMAQFSRRANHVLLNDGTKNFIVINHQHQRIGGAGNIQPGGKTKEYTASIRIGVSRLYKENKEVKFKDGSYILKGVINKNRWGYEDREFNLFVLAGKGVHTGLTIMYDAIRLKLATVNRNVVKIGEESYGHISGIIEEAQAGNDAFFQPFIDVLNGAVIQEVEEETTEEANDE